jgi:putative Holliday junction resolvase
MARILAVDPGDKRIGLAISDLTGTIANPLTVFIHVGRLIDAARIAEMARENDAVYIVVGQPLDSDGQIGPQARKSQRLGEAIKMQTHIPVVYWDESGSTQTAREARIQMGASRGRRKGHMDELAATVILQSYLDANSIEPGGIK